MTPQRLLKFEGPFETRMRESVARAEQEAVREGFGPRPNPSRGGNERSWDLVVATYPQTWDRPASGWIHPNKGRAATLQLPIFFFAEQKSARPRLFCSNPAALLENSLVISRKAKARYHEKKHPHNLGLSWVSQAPSYPAGRLDWLC